MCVPYTFISRLTSNRKLYTLYLQGTNIQIQLLRGQATVCIMYAGSFTVAIHVGNKLIILLIIQLQS